MLAQHAVREALVLELGHHVGPGHLCALEQRVQVGGYLRSVLRAVGGVAPPSAGAVIDAHCAVPGHGGRDPTKVGGGPAVTWFQDDRGAA